MSREVLITLHEPDSDLEDAEFVFELGPAFNMSTTSTSVHELSEIDDSSFVSADALYSSMRV